MFLTEFPINRTRRRTSRLLGSPYQMHAAVAGSFPPTGGRSPESRVLWRVDTESSATYLYMVSPEEPSLIGLDEQIGFPDKPPQWRTRCYDPFLERLAERQVWSFRLTANPVRTVIRDQSRRSTGMVGKRVAHVTTTQQAAWLIGRAAYAGCDPSEVPPWLPPMEESRAARHGFVVRCDEAGYPRLVVSERRRYDVHKSHQVEAITLATAQFDGTLEVIDADRLRHALMHGIGSAKAFGCGLLTLAPSQRGDGATL